MHSIIEERRYILDDIGGILHLVTSARFLVVIKPFSGFPIQNYTLWITGCKYLWDSRICRSKNSSKWQNGIW
ncbi:MAG: hypothetical protein ACTSYI_03555 [Promethearchaeota archaeon]